MKKATHKILMAAASLVIALGVASGTTFAWFTSNRNVKVAQIDATVVTGADGLYVALLKHDGTTWNNFGQSVTPEQIKEALYGTTDPDADALASIALDALTSADHGKSLKPEGVDAEPVTWNKAATKATPNKFIELTFKFRTTTSQNIYLAVDTDGTTNAPSTIDGTNATYLKPVGEADTTANTDVVAWKAITANEYGTHDELAKGADLEARAAHAARVAFVQHAYSEKVWSAPTANGKVWAPYDYETSDGVHTQAGFYKENLARDYRNAFLGTADDYTTANKNEVVLLSKADAEANTPTGKTVLGTTQATTVGDNEFFESIITVRIWLEGTDGDCLNSIFKDKLSVQLVFNICPAA